MDPAQGFCVKRLLKNSDAAQEKAFMEGLWTGRQEDAAEQEERRQAEAREKKPAANVGGEETTVWMGKVAANEAAK